MTNYKKWLDENQVWHNPVEAKDCSACHRTHAGDNFRLLVAEYPTAFYAPYERENYALCYGCHNDKVVASEETTTLTGFRDGSRNLHFVHVNRERGRTCRACHEVHASKQDHHIREGVPYGAKGWVLKMGYTKLPNGGSCAKTCHDTKTYNNKTLTTASEPVASTVSLFATRSRGCSGLGSVRHLPPRRRPRLRQRGAWARPSRTSSCRPSTGRKEHFLQKTRERLHLLPPEQEHSLDALKDIADCEGSSAEVGPLDGGRLRRVARRGGAGVGEAPGCGCRCSSTRVTRSTGSWGSGSTRWWASPRRSSSSWPTSRSRT